jgi:hypothetical protein
MAGDDIKSIVIQDDNMGDDQDIDTKDKSGSEQPSTSTSAGKKAKARHRASVACATCRDRRIRVCPFFFDIHLIVSPFSSEQFAKSVNSASSAGAVVDSESLGKTRWFELNMKCDIQRKRQISSFYIMFGLLG